ARPRLPAPGDLTALSHPRKDKAAHHLEQLAPFRCRFPGLIPPGHARPGGESEESMALYCGWLTAGGLCVALLAATGGIWTVRETQAASCVASSGIVGWWPGEGDAKDVAGAGNGMVEGGVTYAAGKVGN